MPKPIVDTRRVMQGELYINTDPVRGRIPNPIISIIVKQVQRIVADSGYANVTVTVKKAPEGLVESRDAQGQETVKFRNDVALRLRNDNSGLKGPEIEIKTVDGLLAGTYTFDLTRDGFRVRFPAPTALLKQVTWGRKKTNQRQVPQVGFGQTPQVFEQPPRGFKQVSQGFGEAPIGFGQGPPSMIQAPQVFEQSRGAFGQSSTGSDQASQGFKQSSKGSRPDAKVFEKSSSRGLGQAPQSFGVSQQEYEPDRANGGRFYGSASAGNVPPRPVPTQRLPTSTAPRRAPVPNGAFSQSGYRQPQKGFDQARGDFRQPQWQQQGSDNKREKGSSGCCSGGGDSSPEPTSTFERLGMSEEERKKSQKERKKREKEERKRAEKMMKKQKKSKPGGYGGSDGMYAEKSGFYDEKRRESNWCCC